jgi:hypothetical protein
MDKQQKIEAKLKRWHETQSEILDFLSEQPCRKRKHSEMETPRAVRITHDANGTPNVVELKSAPALKSDVIIEARKIGQPPSR